jgi:hypothetical protein
MLFQLLIIIVVINSVATIALWLGLRHVAAVTGKLAEAVAAAKKAAEAAKDRGDEKPQEPTRELRYQLLFDERITPNNQPPPPLKEGASGVSKNDLQFFHDFRDFADTVNAWMTYLDTSPWWNAWRLQELPDSKLEPGPFDDDDFLPPTYGRRYAIFHNQVNLGTLEASGTLYPKVHVVIKLKYVRLLSLSAVQGFLSNISQLVCDPGDQQETDAQQKIDRAITEVLWHASEIWNKADGDYGQIELRLQGSAEFYFERRQALQLSQDKGSPQSGT